MSDNDVSALLARAYVGLHDAAYAIRRASALADPAARLDLAALSRAVDLEVDALVAISRRHLPPDLLDV